MAMTKVVLTANTVTTVSLDAFTSRIGISVIKADASGNEAYATVDGINAPVVPTVGTEVTDTQHMIPPVTGAGVALVPPLPGGHASIVTVQLISAGTPTLLVTW